MKISEVNMFSHGSTGKIMLNIVYVAMESGHDAVSFSPYYFTKKRLPMPKCGDRHIYYGYYLESAVHKIIGRFLGLNGLGSYFSTAKLIKKLKAFSPDVIHIHNFHSFCFNLPLFFKYIKKSNATVFWTLHDCWTFTGHCPHFVMTKCDKWKTGCYKCPSYKEYPASNVDNSEWMYKLKKKWFTGVKNMTLVTPSEWLAGLVKQSFLKDYPVRVINNGIDLSVFKPMHSDFCKKYRCEGKKILLGVAFGWGERKGLDVFVELAGRLPEDYQIVLVGTDENVDKLLPDNIISIHRTDSQRELAEIYTAADLFVNPTREDNYPTVNMEALACGTPVLTFETGGSPEIIDSSCGSVVECDNVDLLESEIYRIINDKPYTTEACLKRAESFDMYQRFREYVELFEESLEK